MLDDVDIFAENNAERIKQLEEIIITLDTFFEIGDDCINPITIQHNNYILIIMCFFRIFDTYHILYVFLICFRPQVFQS